MSSIFVLGAKNPRKGSIGTTFSRIFARKALRREMPFYSMFLSLDACRIWSLGIFLGIEGFARGGEDAVHEFAATVGRFAHLAESNLFGADVLGNYVEVEATDGATVQRGVGVFVVVSILAIVIASVVFLPVDLRNRGRGEWLQIMQIDLEGNIFACIFGGVTFLFRQVGLAYPFVELVDGEVARLFQFSFEGWEREGGIQFLQETFGDMYFLLVMLDGVGLSMQGENMNRQKAC